MLRLMLQYFGHLMQRRDTKGKEEREGYTHPNAEFWRIVRRDRKAYLGEQCKEIEENNRIGKL